MRLIAEPMLFSWGVGQENEIENFVHCHGNPVHLIRSAVNPADSRILCFPAPLAPLLYELALRTTLASVVANIVEPLGCKRSNKETHLK